MSRGNVVMLLTNDFVSDPRVEKEALALSADGWSVTVLAWDRSQSHPVNERRGPISIQRVGPAAPYGGGARNITRFRTFWRLAADRALELAPTVIHCHDLDTAPAGMEVLRRSGSRPPKLVLDFHELYRESRMIPRNPLVRPLMLAFVHRIERDAVRAADRVIIANPGSVEAYAPLGIESKTVLVENAPDLERFAVDRDRSRTATDPFTVCYIGQKRYLDSLRVLMDAVQGDARLHARLHGGGVAADAVAEAAADLDRVEVGGAFVYDDVPGLYRGCDAVFAVYDASVGNIRYASPVKAMEGMAAGLPVIVNRDTWFGRMVAQHGAGIPVEGSDPDEILRALTSLADDPDAAGAMGAKGRAIIEAGLSWEAASARLVDAYRGLSDHQ